MNEYDKVDSYLSLIYCVGSFSVHFRNYTTIHPMLDTSGGADVEVLAYVNSNLIEVIHQQPPISEKNVPSLPVIHSEQITSRTIPNTSKNLSDNGASSSVTVVNEAVISKVAKKEPISNAKKKVVKVVEDPIMTNFTVDGWPINKSRIATDYIEYETNTAVLIPRNPFASTFASK